MQDRKRQDMKDFRKMMSITFYFKAAAACDLAYPVILYE